MPKRRPRPYKVHSKRGLMAQKAGGFGGSLFCVCGKVPYASRSEAGKSMKKLVHKNGRAGDGRPLNVYECLAYPGVWHVGHNKYAV